MGFKLLMILCLLFTLSHQSLYPGVVDTSQILNFSKSCKSFACESLPTMPHINNKEYLNSLAMHVACEVPLNVMVVVGPKDSGKSQGIFEMKKKWKEAGHIVLDLNLKGKPQYITGNDAMKILSKQLAQELQFLQYDTYLHIHECLASALCYNEVNMPMRIIKWSLSNLTLCLAWIIGIISSLFLGNYYTKIVELYEINLAFRCFMAVAVVVAIFTILLVALVAIFPYELLNPIDTTLQSGDWDTLICYLTA